MLPYTISSDVRVVYNSGDDDMYGFCNRIERIVIAENLELAKEKYKIYMSKQYPDAKISCQNMEIKEPII